MTRARRVAVALGSLWLAVTVVPAWVIGGFLLVAITAVVLDSKPTPWAAGLLFVAFDLAWLAATIGIIRVVVNRRRRAR